MKNLTARVVYNTNIYFRLSDDDGDKPESNSIKSQREFITEFLKSILEIHIHAERKDDGLSGVGFFRPGIQEVLQDVRSGAVNYVVVEDLPHLGCNYIETRKVLRESANHGVRFIAINDGRDITGAQGQASTILLSIRNLMNDSYSRDISAKIRSHLEVRKRKSQFVGAFAAYGYLKSPGDKSQLVVDDYATEVAQDTFCRKLEEISQQKIADRLNADEVLSPSEYKCSLGMKYISGFKGSPQAEWSTAAVGHILKDPFYIGVMVQREAGRPNYRIKKLMEKSEDEWIRVPGVHEPIVSEMNFRTVSGLLRQDTRIAVQEKMVYPFLELLFCADCKQSMIYETAPVGGEKYFYYSCSTNRADRTACTTHNISETLSTNAVRDCIRAHMETVLDIRETLQFIAALPVEDMEAREIDRQLEKLKINYEQTMRFKVFAYKKSVDHLLDKDEFKQYRRIYMEKREVTVVAISKRQEELDAIMWADSPQGGWVAHFKSFHHVDVMERKILVKVIDRTYVYEGNRIEIIFRYQNKYRAATAYVKRYIERQATQAASTVKEAV